MQMEEMPQMSPEEAEKIYKDPNAPDALHFRAWRVLELEAAKKAAGAKRGG